MLYALVQRVEYSVDPIVQCVVSKCCVPLVHVGRNAVAHLARPGSLFKNKDQSQRYALFLGVGIDYIHIPNPTLSSYSLGRRLLLLPVLDLTIWDDVVALAAIVDNALLCNKVKQ